MAEVEKNIIVLLKDCTAMMVPSGARILLREGTEVRVTQELGSSITVNVYGNLARIDNKDVDALGREPFDPLAELPENASLREKIDVMLRTVYDPEIPVNIVDLGLIYDVAFDEQAQTPVDVQIEMTLTAPGCGMGPVIAADAKSKVEALDDVAEAHVEIVFDPPWDRDMMSESARLQLGML